MKKPFLFLIALVWSASLYAQISINVRLHANDERLYFGNSHEWMLEHGYHYSTNGYYSSNNNRIYPNRREFYNSKNNTWGNHRYYQQSSRSPQHKKNHYKAKHGRNHHSNYGRKSKR